MRRVTRAFLAFAACVSLGRVTLADPVAYVVNEESFSVSVVDVNASLSRFVFNTNGTNPATSGTHPSEIVFDRTSGRLFVSGQNRLMGFDALLPDGRGRSETPAQDRASCLALDETGRRVFMSHRTIGGSTDGLVTEFSILDPRNPVATQRTVPGVPELRFIAWDSRYRRVYVVEQNGRVVRTDPDTWTWRVVAGAGAPLPGGIIADPAGGVWIATRFPGRMVRVTEPGVRTQFNLTGTNAPADMSWDPNTPNTLLIAMEDQALIWSFNTVTGANQGVAGTDMSPVDAGRIAGKFVSANKVNGNTNGSVTIGAPFSRVGVGVNPVAMVLVDIGRLTAEPAGATYCYNQAGDVSTKTFRIQNTRLDGMPLSVTTPAVVGPAVNADNYTVTSTGCNAATLAWGATCTFNVHFVAEGPSSQPPPIFPIGPFQPATWPAEIVVGASNDASAVVRIPVRAGLSATLCPGGGPIIPRLPF